MDIQRKYVGKTGTRHTNTCEMHWKYMEGKVVGEYKKNTRKIQENTVNVQMKDRGILGE